MPNVTPRDRYELLELNERDEVVALHHAPTGAPHFESYEAARCAALALFVALPRKLVCRRARYDLAFTITPEVDDIRAHVDETRSAS